MHKNLIVTIMLGSDPSYPFVKKSFQAYADRVKADLICITESKADLSFVKGKRSQFIKAISEKLTLGRFLKDYDRVLYLDADILITPHAKNIFEVYPDPSKIYMKDEGLVTDRSKELALVAERLGQNVLDRHYFNAGVILFSKESGFLEDVHGESLNYFFEHAAFQEQTFMNYKFRKQRKTVVGLLHEFNYMGIVGPFAGRFAVSFIHYAGHGFCHKKHRPKLIMNDYCQLYGYVPTLRERLIFTLGYLRSLSDLVARQIKWLCER